MAEFFQFAAQFLMVVDFAVEDDGHIAIFRQNRLIAVTEVDDLEPRRAHGADPGLEHTLLVRTTMNQRGGGTPNAIGIRYPTFMCETNDATQVRDPLKFLENQLAIPANRLAEIMTSGNPGYGNPASYKDKCAILPTFFMISNFSTVVVQLQMQLTKPRTAEGTKHHEGFWPKVFP